MALIECDGMRNGVALLIGIKPIVINVHYSYDSVSLQVEIPKSEFQRWTVSTLREVICFKRGLAVKNCLADLLIVSGNILNDSTQISEIPEIKHNCHLTFTRVERIRICEPTEVGKGRHILLPKGTNLEFARRHCFKGKSSTGYYSICNNSSWTFTIQQLNGCKTQVTVTPSVSIQKLRSAIEKETSVPTHQQRLATGIDSVILEDWNDTGKDEMLLSHYQSLYDSATIFLVQLTNGIRVKVHDSRLDCVEIHNPNTFTVTRLINVIRKYHYKYGYCLCNYDTKQSVCPSDKPITTVDWITDGCVLSLVGDSPNAFII